MLFRSKDRINHLTNQYLGAYLQESLTNDIPKVIYICTKRIAQSLKLLLGCRIVTTRKWFVQCISGVVSAGRAKVDQIIARRPLCRCIF